MAGAGAGADPLLRRRRGPRGDRAGARRARPTGQQATGGAADSRSATVASRGEATRDRRRGPRWRPQPQIANLRDRLSGEPPRHIVLAPRARPASRCQPPPGPPAPAIRSCSPDAKKLPEPTAAVARSAPEDAGLRARPVLGDLFRGDAGDRQDRQPGAAGLRRGPGGQRDRVRPLRATAASAGTSTTPATVSSSPAPTRRWTPPPRRRSRPAAPGARCCSPTAPIRCRRRCAGTCSTSSPATPTDPTRAFYNHVWVIGDQEAIDVKQQAEVDELAELARSAAENERGGEPRSCSAARTRSRDEDMRALAGAVTPHFALQVRNRIRRLIEPLPETIRPGSKANGRSPGWRSWPSTAASHAARSGIGRA